MKVSLLLLLFSIQSLLDINQNKIVLIDTVSLSSTASFIDIDNLGNIYCISGSKIIKLGANSQKTNEYSNKKLNTINLADVSNPLRILLFYKEFNQIVFLDNTMSELGSPILLDDLGHEDVLLSCGSARGGFWLFDQQKGQLFNYNSTMMLINKSVSINSLADGVGSPTWMIEKNNQVYLNIPNYGILVFNAFGSYLNTIPLVSIKDFQLINNSIIYYNNQALIEYDLKTEQTNSLNLPDSLEIINSKILNNNLYIFMKNRVSIYSITKNQE